jgi:hypothetical protein
MNRARHQGASHDHELEDEPRCELDPVVRSAPDPLYWPELDVDLDFGSIKHPGNIPPTFRKGN